MPLRCNDARITNGTNRQHRIYARPSFGIYTPWMKFWGVITLNRRVDTIKLARITIMPNSVRVRHDLCY